MCCSSLHAVVHWFWDNEDRLVSIKTSNSTLLLYRAFSLYLSLSLTHSLNGTVFNGTMKPRIIKKNNDDEYIYSWNFVFFYLFLYLYIFLEGIYLAVWEGGSNNDDMTNITEYSHKHTHIHTHEMRKIKTWMFINFYNKCMILILMVNT